MYIFQFHKGTIKTNILLTLLLNISNFNSIKVRLKLLALAYPYGTCRFQFHKGTIKTSLSWQERRVRQGFQFHKGTIKTVVVDDLEAAKDYFNSIKVRLKLEDAEDDEIVITWFQFHKGTIKTTYLTWWRTSHSISIP